MVLVQHPYISSSARQVGGRRSSNNQQRQPRHDNGRLASKLPPAQLAPAQAGVVQQLQVLQLLSKPNQQAGLQQEQQQHQAVVAVQRSRLSHFTRSLRSESL